MKKFTGKGAYGAIAVGRISVFKHQDIRIKRECVEDIAAELVRLEEAKQVALSQLEGIYQKALREVGEASARIFETHMMMIADKNYNDSVRKIIEDQRVNAEYAVAVTADDLAERFDAMEDAYMRARVADVRDVSNRIISCLGVAEQPQRDVMEEMIICANDLAPGEIVSLDKEKVQALVMVHGSSDSHTVILARNMGIPVIIGLDGKFLEEIRDGDIAIVNGFTGEFIVRPDEDAFTDALRKRAEEQEKKELLQTLKGKEDITLDGTRINICANIDSVDNISAVLQNDASGIGLFRSEFVYLERTDYPTEEEQFLVYKHVLESMGDKKVIIRTLDIGVDKKVSYFDLKEEENPAMGLRAIRLCLTRPEIFKTQLRALYRASVYGKLGIMFPMIVSVNELKDILSMCEVVRTELKETGIPYSKEIELGIMIETPAAAIISDRLAPMVDFFSVGTNDLIQYTLACDRQNPAMESFCDVHHEAVFRLIELAAKNAHENGAWISICGELAADITLTEDFLRMGIDELSVSPTFVLMMRNVVRNIDLRK